MEADRKKQKVDNQESIQWTTKKVFNGQPRKYSMDNQESIQALLLVYNRHSLIFFKRAGLVSTFGLNFVSSIFLNAQRFDFFFFFMSSTT